MFHAFKTNKYFFYVVSLLVWPWIMLVLCTRQGILSDTIQRRFIKRVPKFSSLSLK